MSYAPALSTLQQQAALAFFRHASDPRLLGPADEHERLWALAYEARNAGAEQNPVFALTLLPLTDVTPSIGTGLPLLPVGVRYVVDEASSNTISLSVDVSGPVAVQVIPPGMGSVPFAANVTLTPTRANTTFPASVDGLYTLNLSVGSTPLTTLYVPVQRAEWRRFREQVRANRYAFASRRPALSSDARARLARLICAEAAAHVGDPATFLRLALSASNLPTAPIPVALYRHA